MPKLVLPQLQKKAYLIIIISTSLILFIGIMLIGIKGIKEGNSLILGALVWTIPSFLMALILFSDVSPRAAGKIVIKLYITEVVKLLLTVILSLLLIRILPLSLGFFFVGYLLVQAAFWTIGLIYANYT